MKYINYYSSPLGKLLMAAANLSQKIPAGLTRPEFYFI